MPQTGPAASDATQEIRVALAMNGGVSLAVWIGGAAAEVYRASRGEGSYAALAALTDSRLRIDVLAGSSAGGLNGAFLGAALAYGLPGTVFDELRGVWLSAGSFSNLLRNPREKDPPSLLRGDEYFLPEIEKVIKSWLANRQPTPADTAGDLDLVLTTTTLDPSGGRIVDDAGHVLVDPVHRARLHFSGERLRSTPPEVLAAQLARAARSSASFPGAFEPSFISVNNPKDNELDMSGIASFDSSRWVVDGGVLMNKPIAPAIALIRSHRFASDGRRVLLYVNPDPGNATPPEPSDPAEMPTMLTVITKSLFSLPQAESIARDLEEIRRLHRRQTIQSKFRESLLLGVSVGRDAAEVHLDLAGSATSLYPLWLRRTGITESEDRVADHLDEVGAMPDDKVPGTDYTWRTVAGALRGARGAVQPYASAFPDAASIASSSLALPIDAAGYAATMALDLTRRALGVLPANADEAAAQVRAGLVALRTELLRVRRDADLAMANEAEYWRSSFRARPVSATASDWATALLTGSGVASDERRSVVRAAIDDVTAALCTHAEVFRDAQTIGTGTTAYGAAVLGKLVASVMSGDPAKSDWVVPDESVLARRLLALYIVHDSIEPYTDASEAIEFVQLSADIACPLDSGRTAKEKVTGLQLSHFGGFLKTSWRANDWMWGCLDGAAQVAALFLHPRRIRQMYPDSQSFVTALAPILGIDATAPMAISELNAELAGELAFLDGAGRRSSSDNVQLDRLTFKVVEALQREIAARELPAVAAAIRLSSDERANVSPAAKAFAAALPAGQAVPPGEAAKLLRTCHVGMEKVSTEMRTDAVIELVSGGGAVAAAALSGESSGLGPVRPAFGAIRTALVTMNMFVKTTLSRGRLVVALTFAMLVIGGGVIAAKLLGGDVSTAPLVVAIYLLLAAVLVACFSVGMGWAFGAVGFVAVVIALSSIDEADAATLFGDPDNPGWKPVLQWGGAALSLVLALILVVLNRKRRSRFALLSAGALVLFAGVWWLLLWGVRNHTYGSGWGTLFRNVHEWRALIIVAALTAAPVLLVATVGATRKQRSQRVT